MRIDLVKVSSVNAPEFAREADFSPADLGVHSEDDAAQPGNGALRHRC